MVDFISLINNTRIRSILVTAIVMVFGLLLLFPQNVNAESGYDYLSNGGKDTGKIGDIILGSGGAGIDPSKSFNCFTNASAQKKPTLIHFANFMIAGAGGPGDESTQQYFGITNAEFLSDSKKVAQYVSDMWAGSTVEKDAKSLCDASADYIKSLGVSLKADSPPCKAGGDFAGQCAGGDSSKAAKAQQIVDACIGIWGELDNLGRAGGDELGEAGNLYISTLAALNDTAFNEAYSTYSGNPDSPDCEKIYKQVDMKKAIVSAARRKIEELCKTNSRLSEVKALESTQVLSIAKSASSCEDVLATLADDTGKTSCAVDGIGWIVCPVMKFLGTMNDAAFGFLNNFLEVPSRLFNDVATKAAWETFRNLANVAFIFAFLVIIYSQITSAGVSNYGIKKLLPKLVIAAILVNISFYICAILVDLSNIFGSGLYGLLKNMNAVSGTVSGGGGGSTIWTNVIGGALVGVGVIGLLAVIIFAPMTLLAFALIMIILVGRQAFVILLIVISPLAFVAYLLPNTEQWFKRWWKSLTTMLMVFPIIALVFGASSLASNILLAVSEDCKGSTLEKCTENNQGVGDDDQTLKIAAAAVLAIPLFAVPALLKGSMSAAGSIGGKIAGLQGKANGMAGKSIKNGRVGEARKALDSRRMSKRLNRRVGNGRIGRLNQAIDKSKFGSYIGGDRGAAAATSAVLHEYNEEVGRQKSTMSKMDQVQLMKIVKDDKSSDERRAAAAGVIGSRSFRKGHQELIDYIGDSSSPGHGSESMRTIQQQVASDMKDTPTGMGDGDKANLGEGKLRLAPGRNAAGVQRSVSEEMMLTKLEQGKLTAQGFATLNPDDLALIEDLKAKGHITPEAQGSLNSLIDTLRKPENSNVYAASKDNARVRHDALYS